MLCSISIAVLQPLTAHHIHVSAFCAKITHSGTAKQTQAYLHNVEGLQDHVPCSACAIYVV